VDVDDAEPDLAAPEQAQVRALVVLVGLALVA
jgi:hypothetical protein